MFEGWEGDVLIYNPTFFSLQANARHLRHIREVAEKYGFAISEEAMQVFDDTKKKAKEQMKKWEEERFQKWKEEEYQKW
jgi:N-methylhydantoinase B/oxoprolinase/acetone carboxylase alpha subunit